MRQTGRCGVVEGGSWRVVSVLATSLAVAALLGCGGNEGQGAEGGPEGSADPSGNGAAVGGSSGSDPAVVGGGAGAAARAGGEGSAAGRASVEPQDSGIDARTTVDAGPRNDTALVNEPGERTWQCTVAREPSALGITPSGGDEKLFRTSNGVSIVRLEGGTPGPGGFVNERLVVSSVDMDGVLGSPSSLGAEPGFTYGWVSLSTQSETAQVTYASVSSGAIERQYIAQQFDTSGTSVGAPVFLTVEPATFAFVMPLADGYLAFGGDRDDLRTDRGMLWARRLGETGAPIGDQHTIVQASATQRMANLAPVGGIVQTTSGFLVLYGWFDATADGVDISHYRYRFQALDGDGRPVGEPHELLPQVASHVDGNPRMIARDGGVLVTWTEAERPLMTVSQGPLILRPGNPSWSVIRVALLDEHGALIGLPRTVSPRPAAGVWPARSYWVEHGDDIGLGWYEGETDFTICPQCWAVGTNYFIVLSSDVQSARSEVVSFELQTADAGFTATAGARIGDDILVIGDLSHNLWQEAASATLRCTQ